MMEDGAFSHKIGYVTIFKEILKCLNSSKVTAILLNGWILPVGGASEVKGLRLQTAQLACLFIYTKTNVQSQRRDACSLWQFFTK